MKFSKIKPTIHSGFLNSGFGQEVTYLEVPVVGMEELKSDITAGAKQYTEVLKHLEGEDSQYILIRAASREEGMMAISYLAGEYNKKEGEYRSKDDEGYAPGLAKKAISFSATDELDEAYDEDYEDENFDEDDGPLPSYDGSEFSTGGWEENPWRIPVISYDAIVQQSNMGFGSSNALMLGMVKPSEQPPYWYGLCKESVIVEREIKRDIFYSSSNDILDDDNPLLRGLKRFNHNKRIYLLYIVPEADARLNTIFCNDMMSTEKALEEEFNMLMLCCLAECINIDQSDGDKKKFYKAAFSDIVESYGFSLAKKCSITKILNKIMQISTYEKIRLLDMVVRYCTKGKMPGSELQEKDFETLTRFEKLFGTKDETKKEAEKSVERELVGLEEQKEEINRLAAVLEYQKKRKELGLPAGDFHNTVLLIGPPGTAKTSWAKLCGNLLMEKGLLPGNRFISINGSMLKGKFVGHTSPKVHSLIEENDIILIDECYSLTANDGFGEDTFSQEAVAQLLIEMEEHAMDKLIIFAGYGGKELEDKNNLMKQFLDSNPGIRSRINMTVRFDPYTPKQMVEILNRLADNKGYVLDESVEGEIIEFFEKRMRDKNFGNGREARNLLDNAASFAALRISKKKKKKLSMYEARRITAEDVKNALNKMQDTFEQQEGRTGIGIFKVG